MFNGRFLGYLGGPEALCGRTGCTPQTWVLVVGILVTFGFGVAGAVLYKPREKRTPRFPWEYPK